MTQKEHHQYLLDNIDKMRWKAIPGFEGFYEESDWGLTKSLSRLVLVCGGGHRRTIEQIIIPGKNNMGYFYVNLSKHGIIKRFLVSRLVLETFVGPCPEGRNCLHGPDQNPWDNKLENLRWGTKKENMLDKIVNGTTNRGERCGTHKLNKEQVDEIKFLYATGNYYQKELAEKFNVVQQTISKILNNKIWKY